MWVTTYLEASWTVFRLLHNEKIGEKSYDHSVYHNGKVETELEILIYIYEKINTKSDKDVRIQTL